MKTRLHYYSIDTTTEAGKTQYKNLVHEIEANATESRGRKIRAIPQQQDHKHNTGDIEEIEIDPDCIFENQWNTDSRRVFDWWEEVHFTINGVESYRFRVGHWVEITAEMAAARSETHKCGFCGHHYGPLHGRAVPEDRFCAECLDSPYLKETELHLTRLLPLVGAQIREPLNDDERKALTPRYVTAQTTGDTSRAKQKRDKQRQTVLAEYEKVTTAAKEERDGMLWLWDRGIDLENVIYYDHTRKFSFGWRSPLSDEVVSRLLDLVCEFPFAYEIKGVNRKYESVED